MTDQSYADALARRLLDKPELKPTDDPVWATIMRDPAARAELTRLWASGHQRLCKRWHVERSIGAVPATFTHRADLIVLDIGGVFAGSIELAELLRDGPLCD